MPKLGQYSFISEMACFLYSTVEDAKNGVESGGTGFLVSVKSKKFPEQINHAHVITNKHVAVNGVDSPPCPVIRINRTDGEPEIFEFDVSEWTFIPGKYDIAISPPIALYPDKHDAASVDVSVLLTAEREKADQIGAADDVFMIGRFVDYDGVETNQPAFRFGHISIMSANIKQETGYVGRSIVVDMHSRSGFSGSPVFVYRTLGSHFLPQQKPGQILSGAGHYLRLLGIHWGQFKELWEIKQGTKPIARNAAMITDGHHIEGLSGMTCVIPAAHILEVFNSPELEKMRDAQDLKLTKQSLADTSPRAEKSAKNAAVPTNIEAPSGKGAFNSLLTEAARKRKIDG